MTARSNTTWSAHEGCGRERPRMIGLDLLCGKGLSAVPGPRYVLSISTHSSSPKDA